MEVLVDATIKARSKSIFHDMCNVLGERNYTVRVGRPGKHNLRVKKPYRKIFEGTPYIDEVLNKETKLLVTWWSRSSCSEWDSLNIPRVVLFPGLLSDTWLLDMGLLSESMLIDLMPSTLKPYFDDKCQQWSSSYCKYMIKSNQSKRSQPKKSPLDAAVSNVSKDFVFLPMQFSRDFSIEGHCSMPYSSFLNQVIEFCGDNNLSLVVKHHPDIMHNPKNKMPKSKNTWRLEELKKMNKLFEENRKRCTIFVRDGSIHTFLQNCKFMVGMNTMAHIDAIINNCISFHCGGSPFMNSGAVVHDNDIRRGLDRCLTISSDENLQISRSRKAFIYYLYHRYSLFYENLKFPSEYSNIEKIRNFFDTKKSKCLPS